MAGIFFVLDEGVGIEMSIGGRNLGNSWWGEERGRGGCGGVVGKILDIWLPSFLLPWNIRVENTH